MRAFYTAMLRLRNTCASITRGSDVAPRVDQSTMSFQRVWKSEPTVVVVNDGEAAGAARLSGLPANARLQRLYPAPAATANELALANADGVLSVPAAPLSVQVFLASR